MNPHKHTQPNENSVKPLPIEIRVMRPEFAPALDELQRIIFPTLTPEELFNAEKYKKHMELFPDGQFMAILHHPTGDKVIGSCSAIRTNFNFDNIQHTFAEVTANGWFTTHNPRGEWLYGLDMSVHPKFRRRGIASRMYKVRSNTIKRLNLRGEIAGGMMPGYERYRHAYTIEEYVQAVIDGRVTDPTLTAQVQQGFKVAGILYNHITDPRSDNHAALIVRENPDYVETSWDDMPTDWFAHT